MKCPRCKTGLIVPDRSYDVPALHCMNCGDLFMEERPVVMPEVPKVETVAPAQGSPKAKQQLYSRRSYLKKLAAATADKEAVNA